MDFSSWQGLLLTIGGLALVTLIGVGIRLLVMMTVQQRRERMNRQINERLRTLIAAYKVLGGSFTGNLAVDPAHLRDLRRAGEIQGEAPGEGDAAAPADLSAQALGSDRARRIRDAVEAALSDILLLGTDEHVRLAERAARELVSGRRVHTHELVVSLRDYVRHALQLEPIPPDLAATIPVQGPTRPAGAGGGKRDRVGGDGGRDGGRGSGGMAMGGGAAIGGMGLGPGAGITADTESTREPATPTSGSPQHRSADAADDRGGTHDLDSAYWDAIEEIYWEPALLGLRSIPRTIWWNQNRV